MTSNGVCGGNDCCHRGARDGRRILHIRGDTADRSIVKKTPHQQAFGAWLKGQRLRLDITAAEAARDAGMDPTTWRAYEAAGTPWHAPQPKTVKAIARVLGVPVEDVAQRAGVWMPAEEPSVTLHVGNNHPPSPDVAAKLDVLVDKLTELVDVLGHLRIEPPQPPRRGRKPAP